MYLCIYDKIKQNVSCLTWQENFCTPSDGILFLQYFNPFTHRCGNISASPEIPFYLLSSIPCVPRQAVCTDGVRGEKAEADHLCVISC